MMVHAEFFPGWADFAALLSHLKFVRDHQSKIEKVAAASDIGYLRIIPSVVSHFVKWRSSTSTLMIRTRPLNGLSPADG